MLFWLRRLIRRNTRSMTPEKALQGKKWMSIAYMLVGWNIGGFVLYMCMTGRADWPTYYGLKTKEEAEQKSTEFWAEKLGIKNTRIVSLRGLSKVNEVDYSNENNRSFKEMLEEVNRINRREGEGSIR